MINRKNIWDADSVFFCPIAGFCLSPKEQKSIVLKFVDKKKIKIVTDRMHEFLIGCVCAESKMAKYIQKLLDEKYKDMILHFQSLKNLNTPAVYLEYLNCNDFGAFIWYLSVYMHLSEADYKNIHEDIHDYSHDMYHELGDVYDELEGIYEQKEALDTKFNDIKQAFKLKEKENKQLQEELNMLKIQNIRLNREINIPKGCENSKIEAEKEIRALKNDINLKDRVIAELKSENKKLIKSHNSKQACLLSFEKDFHSFLKSLEEQNNECAVCDKINLCNQRVLIVGGISKISNFYKKMVQTMGGEFFYHDGCCKQDEKQLSELIYKADVVICPIDVNSHAACLSVKKTCKKAGTNYYMLRRSSISSVYNTLTQINNTVN